MSRSIRQTLYLLALSLSVSLAASAQSSTSRISGTVTDTSGAVVPGATVTAKNEATGVTQTQVTTDAGLYSFPSLGIGVYTITGERSGFKTLQQTGNALEVDTPLTVDLALEVGQVSEVVTVQGGAEQLQTANATIGNVVEQKAIEQLPLNGRNPLSLILNEPGVAPRSAGAGSNTISVNGSRDRAFNITIDGIDANESSVPTATNNVYRINPDSIKEYKVTTNNATPEEGRNSGASISIATRSGGNEIHGTVFYFFRNEALNSKEFFANAQGTDKRLVRLNQFGFEASGPIVKNKTFFFGSYQGNRINTTQPIDTSFGVPIVYSPAALSGIFRYFVADPTTPFMVDGQRITQNSPLLVNQSTGALRPEVPLCGGGRTTNCVASYNIFGNDPRGIGADPVALRLFRSYPAPNTYSAVSSLIDGLNTGGYLWNPPTEFRGPAISARVDHTFNDSNSAFARYLYSTYDTLEGDPLNGRPQVFPGFAPLGEVFRTSRNLAISYRRVLSPRVVNEFTMGFSRFVFLFTQGEANPDFPNIPPFDFANVSEPFNNTPRTARFVTTPQFLDNLSIVSGAHLFRLGFNFRFYRHVDQRGQPGGINVTPAITFLGSTRSPAGFGGLPVTFQAPSSTNPNGRAGISSTDSAFLLSSINALTGTPARISQTFLGDLNADAFLPFSVDGQVTLQAIKSILNQYNFYAQDEWKVRPNLTLTYGARWEINPAPSTAGGRVFVPGTPITGTPGPANPVTGQPGAVTFVKADSWFRRNNIGAIGPRVGLAYSPGFKDGIGRALFGESGRSVIRLGYGLAFDPISSFQVTAVAGRAPGLVAQCSSTLTNTAPFNTTTPGCAPAPNLRLGENFPTELAPPTTRPSSFLTPNLQLYTNAPTLTMFDPELKLPTVHQWSASFQRELPGSFVMQAAYIGRRGTRLFRSYDINQINADPILPSFLVMQDNITRGCTAAGAGCPTGVTGTPPPLLGQLVAGGLTSTAATTFINSTAVRTELGRNGAGAFAELIENQTLGLKLRPNQQFNRITYIDSGGDSNYHGMQLTLRRRFGQGLGMNLAYTLAKSIDNGSVDPVGAASGGGLSTTTSRAPVDIRNFNAERARSDFDRRHIFTTAAVWDLPVGRGQRFLDGLPGPLNQLLGDWTINGIFAYYTGEPFSVTSGARTSNNAHVSRADVIAPVEARLQEIPNVIGPVLFANRDAFRLPAPGANGASRNLFTASSYWNLDLGFIKVFNLSERYKIQFRTELFNALNHANFDNPRDATVGSPSILSPVFGQTCCAAVSPPSTQTIIQTGENGRVIQFALKFQF
ncbi:MAG: carboxypeptidase regulatory-like domain-containing protein [Pyrinomonadaceae bacterium]|nr:carboxypeptidase regulatory-like domain-containing protein [Pyrinomonadaceae bacterium]